MNEEKLEDIEEKLEDSEENIEDIEEKLVEDNEEKIEDIEEKLEDNEEKLEDIEEKLEEEQKSAWQEKLQIKQKLSIRKVSESASTQVQSLLEGLKKVQSINEDYLERYKVLNMLHETSEHPYAGENSNRRNTTSVEDSVKKKIIKKNLIKLKAIEHLVKDFTDQEDFQVHQVELLIGATIKTHMSIYFDKESRVLLARSNECVKNVLNKLLVDGYIPTSIVRNIFKIIQDKYYWQMKDDCINLIVNVCEKCKNQDSCLLYVMESMHSDYEYLAEYAEIMQTLLLIYRPQDVQNGIKQLVERCCQLLAECDPRRVEAKTAIEGCLATLASNNEDKILPSIALQTVRVSIGMYRSDIADLLYNLCKDREISGLYNLIDPLILMLDDRDPDVVIRGYQLFTQVLSPTISCLYQIHSTDNFLSHANKISNENQTVCPVKTLEQIQNALKQIILSMLICYIRHAIYPKTLEALLIFNCTIIIEVKDTILLSRITSFLMNLQEAALSLIPIKSMRQSFIQWAVTHLFLLVADVYSISSLKDYVHEVVNERITLAPFLISPIAPSNLESIPPSCLMEKQQVNSIIDNWNELVEPTRTLRGTSPSSSFSFLSAWEEIDSDL